MNNNRVRFLGRYVVEPVVQPVKVRCSGGTGAEIGLRQLSGKKRTHVVVPKLIRALVSACCLFAPFAIAQEEGQRPDGARSHNVLGNSQPTDSFAPQMPSDSQPDAKPKEEGTSEKRGSLVVAPLPISSPALGTGLIPVLAYIFPLRKNDKVSPPSVVGVAGLITNNGTGGFAAFGDFFFREYTYRITSLYVHGNLNYDLYGLGSIAGSAGRKLPLEQSGQVFRGEVLRRVGWQFFLGVRFWTGSSVIVSRLNEGTTPDVPPPPDLGIDTTLRALGLRLKRETSPNRFYPTSGTSLDFTSDFYLRGLGEQVLLPVIPIYLQQVWKLKQEPGPGLQFVCLRNGWNSALLRKLHLRREQ